LTATIGLLGDVMLGRGVAAELRRGTAPEDVWSQEVRELCRSCDLVIVNLECCLSDRGRPTDRVPGKPFFFRAPPVAVESLEAIGVGACGLANNHALDYEVEALEDTLDLLGAAGIAVAGAGRDQDQARRGRVVAAGGRRIGLVAVSDHPASFAAGPEEPGIAFARLERGAPDWLLDEVHRVRSDCELLVAFPHWGPNMTTAPTGWQRGVGAELQAAGADLVAGHSAHCFHGIGWGERGPLLYDLGDALDDYAVDPVLRNDLGVLALWRPGQGEGEVGLELVGLRLDFCHTRLAVGEDAEWIARRLERACAEPGTGVERIGEQRFAVSPP
jgi:poly-gamma-glutamate capsule biosynthesis protein CapA/YwtB (metallophosphatase superfamily)